jgi:hypothetical protein
MDFGLGGTTVAAVPFNPKSAIPNPKSFRSARAKPAAK